jgi:hypothetical protein
MSLEPDFTVMKTQKLRAYLLEYRDNEEALQTYLDRRRSESPSSRVYRDGDDVGKAISEYLKSKG